MIGPPSPSSSTDHMDTWGEKRKKAALFTLEWNVGHHPWTCQEYTLTVGIMQELGLWLQMTKRGNLIKYRICKSICAEDYKGSASLNPQSDISPNGSYINRRWTRRASLKRPCLHFPKHSLMEWMYVTGPQPLCPTAPEVQLRTLFSAPDSVKQKYFIGHWILSWLLTTSGGVFLSCLSFCV